MNYIKHQNSIQAKFLADKKITSTHISLYNGLFQIWNSLKFPETFTIVRDEAMKVGKIGSANTYTKILKELHCGGYIEYYPSYNPLIASTVKLINYSYIDTERAISNSKSYSFIISNKSSVHDVVKAVKWFCNSTDNSIATFLKTLKTDKTDKTDKTKTPELPIEIPDLPKDFLLFWDSYHEISKTLKSDKNAAEKYWDKMSNYEKEKAVDKIQDYVNSISDKKFIKKARTYLADKNYNDEFKISNSKLNGNSEILKGSTHEQLSGLKACKNGKYYNEMKRVFQDTPIIQPTINFSNFKKLGRYGN